MNVDRTDRSRVILMACGVNDFDLKVKGRVEELVFDIFLPQFS
jgi:hypothetical protein